MDLTRWGALALLAGLALPSTVCEPQRPDRLEHGPSTVREAGGPFGGTVTAVAQAGGSPTFVRSRQPWKPS